MDISKDARKLRELIYASKRFRHSEKDDIYSAVLVRLCEKRQVDAIDDPERWMKRSLKYMSYEFARQDRKWRSSVDALKSQLPAQPRWNGETISPAETSDRDELPSSPWCPDLQNVWKGLSALEQEVLTLCILQGLSPVVVAMELGRPRSTVSSCLRRGLQKLRALLPDSCSVRCGRDRK